MTVQGQHFIKQTVPTDFPLYSIDFADSLVGYIGGSNAGLLKTTDAGKTWQKHNIKNAPWIFGAMDIVDLDFINKDSGFAVLGSYTRGTTNTMIWRTEDGGTNWTSVRVTVNMVPWKISPIQFDSGLIGGSAFFQGSVISNISGDSVLGISSFSWDANNWIETFARHQKNPDFIMAATNLPSIHHSFDGGITWDTAMTQLDTGFTDLIHLGGNVWVASINNGQSLQLSKDSGKTWAWQATTFAYPTYLALSYSIKDSLIAFGYSESFKMGEISYYTNSIQSYQNVPMRLFATACNSAGNAFVVGDSSAIYRRMGNHPCSNSTSRRK